MTRLKQLIREAHRRSLWQVLAIYVAGSFGALQIVEMVAENIGLPGWTTAFAFVLLVIGLPVVLATAFVQEGGPIAIPMIMPQSSTTATEEGAQAAPSEPPSVRRRFFSWRNALLGGAGAFAVFGLSTAGFMALRNSGVGPFGTLVAQGVLSDRAVLVVSDLQSTTGDTLLARAFTEALRVDLAQSRAVRVLEAAR